MIYNNFRQKVFNSQKVNTIEDENNLLLYPRNLYHKEKEIVKIL